MPVDALVPNEIARVPGRAVPCQVRRRANHDEPNVAGYGNGDHVLVDHLTEPDLRIESLGDDVERLVTHEEVQLDVGELGQKTGEHGSAEEALRGWRDVEAKHATRFVAELADVRHRDAHLVERGARGRIHALTGRRQPHAPRGPLHEGNAQPFLEAPQCLTDRGVTDAEPLASGAKAFRFRDSDEHGHPIQVVGHWTENLPAWNQLASRSTVLPTLHFLHGGHPASTSNANTNGTIDPSTRFASAG